MGVCVCVLFGIPYIPAPKYGIRVMELLTILLVPYSICVYVCVMCMHVSVFYYFQSNTKRDTEKNLHFPFTEENRDTEK